MSLPDYIEDILKYRHKDSNLPIGVSKQKGAPRRYKAEVILNGKKCYLGLYDCPYFAHANVQYKVFTNAIDSLQRYQNDERFLIQVAVLILSHIEKLARDIQLGNESLRL